MEISSGIPARRTGLTALLACVACLIPPAAAAGQATAGDAGGEADLSVQTQLVLVDVVVQRNGQAVTGLTEADFRISAGGDDQEIAVFEVVSGAPETPAVELPAGVSSNRRDSSGLIPTTATVVLIDRLNTPTDAQVFTNQRLTEFFRGLDQVGGIALYELLNDSLRIVHDFTADPQALVDAAEGLEPEHSLSLASSDSGAGGFESELDSVGLDRVLSEDFLTGNSGFERLSTNSRLNDRALKTSAALETITMHLEGLPGRKNIVWLSGRFPFTFDVWSRTDLAEQVERSTMQQIEDVGVRIVEANIAVYPVDVRGPGGEGADVGSVVEKVSETTGARSFRTNAVGNAITAAVSDAELVYTLGFYPSEIRTDGSFREIDIEVEGEDLDVRYRPGYFAFGGGAINMTPRVGMAEVLASQLDSTAVGLNGIAASADDGTGRVRLLLLVDVDDLTLKEIAGRKLGVIDMGMIFRADDDGTVFVLPGATHSVNLSAEEYASAQQTGVVVQQILNTEGRDGTFRIGVHDQASGRYGSVWVPTRSR